VPLPSRPGTSPGESRPKQLFCCSKRRIADKKIQQSQISPRKIPVVSNFNEPRMAALPRVDKILVVDDDARMRDLLRRYLTQQGFAVLLAEDGRAMSRLLLRDTVDLIVLDVMMPGDDGLTVCRKLRSAKDLTPVIMLTAKGEDVDRIVGLEVGADDYLGKPFNPRELLARINAVLRRRPAPETPGSPSADQEVVTFGPFSFDLGARSLRKGDEELAITTAEFAMLKALVRHPRVPLSREKLAQLARGRGFEPFDRSLDVQVSRLRKLIEVDVSAPRYIQTVWGIGYVFIPDGNA
jgi:two-component system phosphate regulon response regulator OmpR